MPVLHSETACAGCGTVFHPKQYSPSHKIPRFCSRACGRKFGKVLTRENFIRKYRTDGKCWIWSGYKNQKGYGALKFRGKSTLAHRAAYELLVGPIPDGLEIDHKCRNRLCVNPLHLEPVTHKENVGRGEDMRLHCKRGHARVPHSGRCLMCHRLDSAVAREKKRNPQLPQQLEFCFAW